LRYQRNSGQTGTSGLYISQSFESLNSIPLAGRAVTLSFYARAGANYSAASSSFLSIVYSGTGTDQQILSGLTGSATPINQTSTLTTTWQRFTYSGTIASTATQIGLLFGASPTGTAGANDYFEITGVQLEASSVASAYAPNGATYQAELAACQRYYWRSGSSAGSQTAIGLSGITNSTTNLLSYIRVPSTMRVTPTSVDFSSVGVQSTSTGLTAISAITIATESTPDATALNCTTTGLTNNQFALVRGTTGTGYIGLSAEL
jgi:hypothetical protein